MKVRDVAKVTKKYGRHEQVTAEDMAIMSEVLIGLNPAAIQRHIQALTAELLTFAHQQGRCRPQARSSGQHEARVRS